MSKEQGPHDRLEKTGYRHRPLLRRQEKNAGFHRRREPVQGGLVLRFKENVQPGRWTKKNKYPEGCGRFPPDSADFHACGYYGQQQL